jgi:hypothetical protein
MEPRVREGGPSRERPCRQWVRCLPGSERSRHRPPTARSDVRESATCEGPPCGGNSCHLNAVVILVSVRFIPPGSNLSRYERPFAERRLAGRCSA